MSKVNKSEDVLQQQSINQLGTRNTAQPFERGCLSTIATKLENEQLNIEVLERTSHRYHSKWVRSEAACNTPYEAQGRRQLKREDKQNLFRWLILHF